MILSDNDVRKLVHTETPLIEPFDEGCLQGASYDLSMANKILAFRKHARTINLADQENIDSAYEQIDISERGYILNPGEYILVMVKEKVSIPVNMVAHIRPRTRFTRLGILLSAQHCNPGYTGVLSLGMYNASPNAIILVPDLHIAQIVFERLESKPSKEKQYQNKKNAAYMNEDGLRGSDFKTEELSPAAKRLYENVLKQITEG